MSISIPDTLKDKAVKAGINVEPAVLSGKPALKLSNTELEVVVPGLARTEAVLDMVLHSMDLVAPEVVEAEPVVEAEVEPAVIDEAILADAKPSVRAIMAACDSPASTAKELFNKLSGEGVTISKNTVAVKLCDVRRVLAYLGRIGKLAV